MKQSISANDGSDGLFWEERRENKCPQIAVLKGDRVRLGGPIHFHLILGWDEGEDSAAK